MTQYEDNPSYAYCTKYVITAVNKQRTPINCAAVEIAACSVTAFC